MECINVRLPVSHGSRYEDGRLLGCYVVLSDISLLTFQGACCRNHHTLMMEAASTSETVVNFYQTTWYNPEDSHLQRVTELKISVIKFHFVFVYSVAPHRSLNRVVKL
jgi:hypothetical protein